MVSFRPMEGLMFTMQIQDFQSPRSTLVSKLKHLNIVTGVSASVKRVL